MNDLTSIFANRVLLVVEDDPALREMLVMELDTYGAKVIQASNGAEAFALIVSGAVDAVVSDIRMPGGDGMELLQRLKAHNPEIPTLMFITGFSDVNLETAYDIGAEAILPKPFDLDQLSDAVRRLVTPKPARWRAPEGHVCAQVTIHRHYPSLENALRSGELRLGRGGVFIKMESALPARRQKISFKLEFGAEGGLDHGPGIVGCGIVRWTRSQPHGHLSAGCGIEFEHLTPESSAYVCTLGKQLRLKAYIPQT